jgi:dimethylhistidine N-methyltransferase
MTRDFEVIDLEPPTSDFRTDVLAGLSSRPRSIPPKYLYDERGSALFDDICESDDYYVTQTEISILEDNLDEIRDLIGPRPRVVELGSGTGLKTRMFLNHLESPSTIFPIDISKSAVLSCAREVAELDLDVEIIPICADYTRPLELPETERPFESTVAFFPGSTLGNFEPKEQYDFLSRIADMCGEEGGLLIGVDLVKDPQVLHKAYNDSDGATSSFNLNLLRRMNRELEASFDFDDWSHRDAWQPRHQRMEMRLLSGRDQTVEVADESFDFRGGEHIVTEHSYKFTREGFAEMAREVGFRDPICWTDDNDWFSLWYLQV